MLRHGYLSIQKCCLVNLYGQKKFRGMMEFELVWLYIFELRLVWGMTLAG